MRKPAAAVLKAFPAGPAKTKGHATRRAQAPGAADGIDIEAFQRGDTDAVNAVLERFGPTIKRIAAMYTTEPDAQSDLYQEICIRVWERHGDYRDSGKLSGWITKLGNNHARNWVARRKRRREILETYATTEAPVDEADALDSDPLRMLGFTRFLERLTVVLPELPEEQRKAYELVCVEGYRPHEVALQLGVSARTVRSNVRHARKRLRESMEDAIDELS